MLTAGINAPCLQKAAVKAPYYQKKANLVASRGGWTRQPIPGWCATPMGV